MFMAQLSKDDVISMIGTNLQACRKLEERRKL